MPTKLAPIARANRGANRGHPPNWPQSRTPTQLAKSAFLEAFRPDCLRIPPNRGHPPNLPCGQSWPIVDTHQTCHAANPPNRGHPPNLPCGQSWTPTKIAKSAFPEAFGLGCLTSQSWTPTKLAKSAFLEAFGLGCLTSQSWTPTKIAKSAFPEAFGLGCLTSQSRTPTKIAKSAFLEAVACPIVDTHQTCQISVS